MIQKSYKKLAFYLVLSSRIVSIYDDEIINNVPRKSITSCFCKRSSKVHFYFVKKSKYFQK